MLNISNQQVLERWDFLPDTLKEALFSSQNTDILQRICESQHISQEKIYSVATMAGDVIFGFIHPEDLEKEIRTGLNLNQQISSVIATEINQKIFIPIKPEIDKMYGPIFSAREELTGISFTNKNVIAPVEIHKIEEPFVEQKKIITNEPNPIIDLSRKPNNLPTRQYVPPVPQIKPSAPTQPIIYPAPAEVIFKKPELPKPKIEEINKPIEPKLIEENKIIPKSEIRQPEQVIRPPQPQPKTEFKSASPLPPSQPSIAPISPSLSSSQSEILKPKIFSIPQSAPPIQSQPFTSSPTPPKPSQPTQTKQQNVKNTSDEDIIDLRTFEKI